MATNFKMWGANADEVTRNYLKFIGLTYGSSRLVDEMSKSKSTIYSKDVYICLKNIIDAVLFNGSTEQEKIKALQNARNLYNSPIFAVDYQHKDFAIKNLPDFQEVIDDLKYYSDCFKLNIYSIVNTVLSLIVAQVTGYNLNKLFVEGVGHIERFIEFSLINNKNWNAKKLSTKNPKLIMPIGAAGCGKSTFYRELSNVVNISCDNIRYLLFKDFGPCFQSWESGLSWWVVNALTDYYLNKGYSVFYNGVNTDLQYRSPMTNEAKDPIFEGLPYDIRLVYFEPLTKLNKTELDELKNINLWQTPIEKVDLSKVSPKVRMILEMIKNNVERTYQRTKEIREGKKEQDPFDILYAVPAPIVKLFVEQNFDKPTGKNVIVIPRKEIPDEIERQKFYREYADKVLNS
ncbi:MAG TPA: hypothetical protein PLM75_10635 [bacterium]|nr:hypothetical protein [bacterium]